MEKRCIKNSAVVISLLSIAIVIIAFISAITMSTTAYAELKEKNLTVKQDVELLYFGENYLSTTSGKNQVFSALTAKLDNEEIELNTSNASIKNLVEIYEPGQYFCDIHLTYDDNVYVAENVEINLSKRLITVVTLLNGSSNLTIKEGEAVTVVYDYRGAIESDFLRKTVSGVDVNVLKDEMITRPAFVEAVPTEVVTNYTVVASYAESKYYDFEYTPAYITILPNTVNKLSISNENKTLASIHGTFSINYTFDYVNIGINKSSPKYASVQSKINERYESSDLLDNYKQVAYYNLVVKNGDDIPNSSISANVEIFDETLKGESKYKVLAIYNNGTTEILDATYAEGVLKFLATDMGDFVVLGENTGINTSTYIFAIIGGIIAVLLVVLFVALFRKKY